MTYNPDDLESEAEGVSAGDFEQTAEITAIVTTTAGEVYGENLMGDEDKEVIEVTATTEGDTEIKEIFSTPSGPMSWRNPQFKLGQFREEYGKVPREGMTVNITVDDDGFLAIDY